MVRGALFRDLIHLKTPRCRPTIRFITEESMNIIRPAGLKSLLLAVALIATSSVSQAVETATLSTDVLRLVVSSEGGSIVGADLIGHQSEDHSSPDYPLMGAKNGRTYLAQEGLVGIGLPTHKAPFRLLGDNVQAMGKDNKVSLDLVSLVAPEGVEVSKRITLHRGSYVATITTVVENRSHNVVSVAPYYQLSRDGQPADIKGSSGSAAFVGPVFYTEEGGFKKVTFRDIETRPVHLPESVSDGWFAIVQRFFVSGWDVGTGSRDYYVRKTGQDIFTAGALKSTTEIAPSSAWKTEARLYVGPQIHNQLNEFIPGFDQVADYGWLRVICTPLFTLLQGIHSVLGNWGWAILALTFLVRLAFIPVSASGYRSMDKLKSLSAELDRIKELNVEDKEKMQQELLSLYRREGVNPLGGCLPILIQIPVFLGLYWVLGNLVELRGASWFGWITDLSQRDPLYILPIMLGLTSYIQMRMSPVPRNEYQALVLKSVPLILAVVFITFPSGLVLYWVGTNIFSILQHLYVSRRT